MGIAALNPSYGLKSSYGVLAQRRLRPVRRASIMGA